MTEGQIAEVLKGQRTGDLRFGELAREMGFLEETQLEVLLQEQQHEHLHLGEALLRNGDLTRDRLEQLLDCFKTEESEHERAARILPEALHDHPVLEQVLEFFPRLSLRIARLWLKSNPARVWQGTSARPHLLTITLGHEHHLNLGLAASRELGERVASQMLCCEVAELEEGDVDDALGEFMNIVAGRAKTELESAGHELSLSIPDVGRVPATGFVFDLVTTGGDGELIVSSD